MHTYIVHIHTCVPCYIWRCKQVSHEWFNNSTIQPFNPSESWNKSSNESKSNKMHTHTHKCEPNYKRHIQIKTKKKKDSFGESERECDKQRERVSESECNTSFYLSRGIAYGQTLLRQPSFGSKNFDNYTRQLWSKKLNIFAIESDHIHTNTRTTHVHHSRTYTYTKVMIITLFSVTPQGLWTESKKMSRASHSLLSSSFVCRRVMGARESCFVYTLYSYTF